VLDVLLRYEVAFDRQYARALNLLLKLRTSASLLNVTDLPQSAEENQELAASAESAQSEPEILKFPNET